MQSTSIKIGLLGCGTVGSGVVKLLQKNQQHLTQRLGSRIEIKKILELNPQRVVDLGLDSSLATDDYPTLLADPEISIIVELIGGIEPARTFVLDALKSGKNVVTANKDLIALHGKELFEAADTHKKDLYFEASVGGGIPIIGPLKQSLAANEINTVMGIVNGTTNYVLTKMDREGQDYQKVLQEAQNLGYAESDPTSDVEGLDAARKLAILASIAFGTRITFPDVYVEGITRISPLDLAYGKELGYALKLLAIGKNDSEGIDVRVHPAFIPVRHPLAAVDDVFNAIFIQGNFVGDVMHYGRGAGQDPTASAVIGDVMEVARNIASGHTGRNGCTCFEQKPLKPISEVMSRYYIRMMLDDRPGVLASIAGVFGNQQVSVASVIQKRTENNFAELVFVTHRVKEGNLQDALKVIQGMSIVGAIHNVIRVEGEIE